MPTKKILAVFILAFIFVFIGSDSARAISCDANVEGKSDSELQAILDQCDMDILAQKAILEQTQKQSSDLEKGIAEFTYNINKTQIEINARNAKIKKLGENITTKTVYIGELSVRMENIRKSISKMIKDSYALDSVSIVEVAFSGQELSTIFLDLDNYSTIDQKLNELTDELTNTKKTSETEKKDLETRKVQEEKLKFEQDAEKRQLENLKKEKQAILTATKGQESAYKKIIADKEKLKTQIRNKLLRTVGGQELKFGDALKLIKPYESTIGVSSALVMAVLFQESAVDNTIGKNIGQCTYNKPSSCIAGKTVMSDTQKPFFLNLMSNLGLNPDKTPVSCAICRDGNYGGAMGPAQFMPETWNAISKSVSRILNVADPSPFESLHAFTAAGVLLKENQDVCKKSFSKKSDLWACSASKYYGGINLKGSKLTNFMYYGYGASVAKRAAQFEKDIDTLDL